MEKLVTLCAVVLTLSASLMAQKQEVRSSQAPLTLQTAGSFRTHHDDFQWKDLTLSNYKTQDFDGKEIDVQAMLADGKFVLIDFSAHWCNPCWQLHKNHLLEHVYEKFGPNGTLRKDLVVLWIEGQGNERSKIENASKNWTLKYGTQEKVPYPVISDKFLAGKFGITVNVFPTLVLLAPTGKYMDALPIVQGLWKDIDSEKLLAIMNTTPLKHVPPQNVEPKSVDFGYAGDATAWTAGCVSVDPITAYKWTFEGGSIATSEEKSPVVTWAKPGTYKVTLTLTNKTGSATAERQFVVKDPAVTQFPVVANFDEVLFPTDEWRRLSVDGDPYTWENMKDMLDRLNLKIDPGAKIGYKSLWHAVSWTFYPTSAQNGPKGLHFSGDNHTPNNWLISPVLNIPANAEKPTLVFALSSFFDEPFDRCKVVVSTTSLSNPQAFKEVLIEEAPIAGRWKLLSVDLSKFKGQRIAIAFVHSSKQELGSGITLDYISVALDGSFGAADRPEAKDVLVYPTIANKEIQVKAAEHSSVVLFDIMGRQIESTHVDGEVAYINVENLANGTYFVRVIEVNGAAKVVPFIVEHE